MSVVVWFVAISMDIHLYVDIEFISSQFCTTTKHKKLQNPCFKYSLVILQSWPSDGPTHVIFDITLT